MTNEWRTVRLGDVLTRVKRPVKLDPATGYPTVGVRWYGAGVFLKESQLGSKIAATSLNEVHEHDIVYSRLFAWKGSFGVVGPKHHGAVASNEFPTYLASEDLLPEFFALWSARQEVWDFADAASIGSTANSRNRLGEEEFLELEVELPSLAEQRRVVASVQALSMAAESAVAQAEALRHLARAGLRRSVEDGTSKLLPLGSFAELDLEKVSVDRTTDYLIAGVKIAGEGLFSRGLVSGSDTNYPQLTRLRGGQLVYRKLTAWEGPITVVSEDFAGHWVSPEFPTFTLDRDEVDLDVMRLICTSPAFHLEMKALSTGTAERRGRLKPQELLEIEVELPPLSQQRRLGCLCRFADALDTEAGTARPLRAALIAELVAGTKRAPALSTT